MQFCILVFALLPVGSAAFADEPQIEIPEFKTPAQSFTAPTQTGTARSAQVNATGLYKLPEGSGPVFCLGRKLPTLDSNIVFVPVVDDFYTGGNVVWMGSLEFQGDPGTLPPPPAQAKVNKAAGFIAVCRAEQDQDFQHNYLKELAPNWYYDKTHNIIGTRRNEAGEREPNPVHITVTVPAPQAQGTAQLRVALNSDAPPKKQNKLSVSLNGTAIPGDAQWEGPGYRIIDYDIACSLLRDGENAIELLGDSDYVKHLDWVEIAAPAEPRLPDGGLVVTTEVDATLVVPDAKYAVDITDFGIETLVPKAGDKVTLKAWRLYFFTDNAAPLTFSEETKLVRPVAEGVDYLALGARATLPALEPLLKQKRDQGMKTTVAALEDVLAVYNGGVFGPDGVRAMLRDLKPKYLLIAGGFDRDCRRRQENHRANPAWQRGVPAYLRQLEQLTVTDDPYTLDNTIKVGRVPLNDAESLNAWATKAAAYAPPDSVVLLAGSNKDYDFSSSQERQAPAMKSALITAEGRQPDDVRRDLFHLMDDGARLGIYQGHAQSWEIDKGLLDSSSAASMPASSWVLATCNAGYYQGDFEVYLRDWMRAPKGGCVNAIAASSIGTAGDQDQLIRQFLFYLRSNPETDWGGAMEHLKRNLPFNEKTMKDPDLPKFVRDSIARDRLTIDAYSLFGDPAARVLAPATRTATFERANKEDSDGALLTLSGNWEPAMLAKDHLGIEWRAQDGAPWQALALATPLVAGENTITLDPKLAGDYGGRVDLRVVERVEGMPPFTWTKTKLTVDSVLPGVPDVIMRQARSKNDTDSAAVVILARSEKVFHRGHSVETQFEVREKANPAATTHETEWLPEQRYRYETDLPAGHLEARAHWRKNGTTGEWSAWASVVEAPGEKKPAP